MLYQAWMNNSVAAFKFFKNKATSISCSLNLKTFPSDKESIYKLGICYLGGIGVSQSDEEAHNLFLLASKQGVSAAQTSLALMYQLGRAGLHLAKQKERDEVAVRLYEPAAEGGCYIAQNALGYLYQRGRAGLHLANQQLRDEVAVGLYEKAAESGYHEAQANLGYLYCAARAGQHLANQQERDEIAVKLFEKAVERDLCVALYNLAFLYESGRAGLHLANEQERNKHAAYLYRKAFAQAVNSKRAGRIKAHLKGLDVSSGNEYHLAIIDKDYEKLASVLLQSSIWKLFLQFDRKNIASNSFLINFLVNTLSVLDKQKLDSISQNKRKHELKLMLFECQMTIEGADKIDYTQLTEESRKSFVLAVFNIYISIADKKIKNTASELLLSFYENHKTYYPKDLVHLVANLAITKGLNNSVDVSPRISTLSHEEVNLICAAFKAGQLTLLLPMLKQKGIITEKNNCKHDSMHMAGTSIPYLSNATLLKPKPDITANKKRPAHDNQATRNVRPCYRS